MIVTNLSFHILAILSITSLGLNCTNGQKEESKFIQTVNGPISTQELGLALSHEHVMSNFGRPMSEPAAYDQEALMGQVVPYITRLKEMGVASVFDCTTAYFGRRVDILKRVSDSTGVRVITNTGFYGAANDRYVPEMCFQMSAREIADIWIDEWEMGIDDTDIRPGFIKLAFDHGSPSDIDLKLFEAGCLAHKSTGLTLAVHTGDNALAVEAQLDMLAKHSIDFVNWIWVHANKSMDDDLLLRVAREGAWISLDGVKESNVMEYINRLNLFKDEDLLGRVLLSHDGNGFPGGKSIRPFEAILSELIPTLLDDGFKDDEIKLLLQNNPARAFGL